MTGFTRTPFLFAASALALLAYCPSPALAAEEASAAPDYASEKLSGDWGGSRTWLYNQGYDVSVDYTADFWRNLSGGVQQGNRVNDNLKLIVDVDGEKAFGSQGTSAHFFLLNNFGGRINDLVGSNGGIDNMEVPEQAFKLFEAWVQQNFWDDKVSVLVGLHDLNTEFYVTDSSGLFLNPTYGIGTEMAATGDNGPSVFPYSSLGARIRIAPTDNTYVMGAIYDGVPGDPNRPRGTHVRFNDNDGALNVVEAGLQDDSLGHFGIGAWNYTAKRPDLVVAGKMANSRGVYFLADHSFYKNDAQDISAFLRVGLTDGNVDQFKSNTSIGVVASGFVPSRPDAQIGFAVTQNANSSKFKEANAGIESTETQWELTYSDTLMPAVTIQPDLQYTVNPGTDPSLDNAWTAGLRVGIAF